MADTEDHMVWLRFADRVELMMNPESSEARKSHTEGDLPGLAQNAQLGFRGTMIFSNSPNARVHFSPEPSGNSLIC